MGRKTTRGRCSLSFDVPDHGTLDLDDILRLDPWKQARHFDGTDAGHVQDVLNQFDDAIRESKKQPSTRKDRKRRTADARGDDEEKVAPINRTSTGAHVKKAGNGVKAETSTGQADKHVDQAPVGRGAVTRKAKQATNNAGEDKKSTRKRATKAPRSRRTEVRTPTGVKTEPLDEKARLSAKEACTGIVQVKREPLVADLANLEQTQAREDKKSTRKRATKAPRSPRTEVRTPTGVKTEPLDERAQLSAKEARPGIAQVKREPLVADLVNLGQTQARSSRLETSTPKRRPLNSRKGRASAAKVVKKENVSPVQRTETGQAGRKLEKAKDKARDVAENKKSVPKETQVKKERLSADEAERNDGSREMKERVKPEMKKETESGRRKAVDQGTRATETEKSGAYRRIARQERKAARAMDKFSRHVMRIVAKMGYPADQVTDYSSESESDESSSSSGSEYSWTCSCSCSSYCSCSSCSPGRSGGDYSEYTLNCSRCGNNSD